MERWQFQRYFREQIANQQVTVLHHNTCVHWRQSILCVPASLVGSRDTRMQNTPALKLPALFEKTDILTLSCGSWYNSELCQPCNRRVTLVSGIIDWEQTLESFLSQIWPFDSITRCSGRFHLTKPMTTEWQDRRIKASARIFVNRVDPSHTHYWVTWAWFSCLAAYLGNSAVIIH